MNTVMMVCWHTSTALIYHINLPVLARNIDVIKHVTVPPMDYFCYHEMWQSYLEEKKDLDVLIVHYEHIKEVN